MKKYLMIVALAALQFSAIAQTVNVHLKNGQIIKYPSSDFDYIDFSAKPTSGDDSIYVHFNAHVPNSLKQPAAKGFGVFSYYDDNILYSLDYTKPNYMYNQQVKYTGAEWNYEPLRTWQGYLSFFAYAPWTYVDPSWGFPVGDSKSEKNITSISTNRDTGDPIIKYVVDPNPATSVDLMWGVATSDGYTTTTGNNLSYVEAGKPYLNITSPQNSTNKLDFTLRHALAKLNVTIDYYNAFGDFEKTRQTKMFVRKVIIGGCAMQGALNLNNTKANIPNWKAYDGTSNLGNTNNITIYDGRRDGNEGTLDGADAEETNLGLNHAIIQSTPYETEVDENGNTVFTSSWNQANPGVTTKTVNLFNSEDVSAPIYVIPMENKDFFIEIVYDVETVDPTLQGKLSDGVTNGISIENIMQKFVLFGTQAQIQAGKEYTINLHLEYTSVKATGTVQDWTE